MDEEIRKKAHAKISNAHSLERKQVPNQKIIDEYMQAIQLFLTIQKKTTDDLKHLAESYYDLATFYFNKNEHVKAGECYVQAIQQLLQTELKDDGYRRLTELYIDLADACYESWNQQAGDEAMTNAIKAFGFIQKKTFKEEQIGDPVKNFKAFHKLYEENLSTESYLGSSRFTNHELLLKDAQVNRQMERELFDQFGAISIGEMKQMDDNLENILSQLSLTAEKSAFNPVLINPTPSDGAYRDMAMQLLTIAKSHVQKKLIPQTIETYQQAIAILKMIKKPQASDHQIVQHLGDQIEYLQNKSVKSGKQSADLSLPQETQRPSSMQGGFFAQSFSQKPKEEFREDSEEDVDMMENSGDYGVNM